MEEGFAGSRLWALLVASPTEEETGPLESNGAGGWERAALPCHSSASGGLWQQHPGASLVETGALWEGAELQGGVQRRLKHPKPHHLAKHIYLENINKRS